MSRQRAGLVVTLEPQGFVRATVSHHLSLQGIVWWTTSKSGRGGRQPRMLLDLSYAQPPGPVEETIVGEHMARQLSHSIRWHPSWPQAPGPESLSMSRGD
jgi:hypothetical protein